ncbi:MAG: radical SAM family heme chaperone HemW [bacterium]
MTGLYCHIPFCMSKCRYCTFFSVTSLRWIPAFMEGMKKEAELYAREGEFSGHDGQCLAFDTLYLGGGTPSVIEVDLIAGLVRHLRLSLPFSPDAEITMETNPGDLSPHRLEPLLEAGVNRLTIGVQSFSDRNLVFLGRRHTAEQAEGAIRIARQAGITNLGIDLIYGLPGQSLQSWKRDLDRATGLAPEHISCYQLTVEHDTPLGEDLRQGRIAPLPERKAYDFFITTSRLLTGAGYEHYEISNFSRGDRNRSRHNGKYWQHVPYLGLGPSAHSFSGARRWWNHASVERYCAALTEGRLPVEGSEELGVQELRTESLYVGFRTRDGIDLARFRDGFGQDLEREPPGLLAMLEAQGRVKVREGRVIPTLQGMAVADAMTTLFIQ